MKGDELNYQIQAIQLNKIDEVSVEHSSEPTEKSEKSMVTSQESSIGNLDVQEKKHSAPDVAQANVTPLTNPDTQQINSTPEEPNSTLMKSKKSMTGSRKIKESDFNENMQFVKQARDTGEVE